MKLSFLTTVLAAGAMTVGSLAVNSEVGYSKSLPSQRGFWCDMSSGTPVVELTMSPYKVCASPTADYPIGILSTELDRTTFRLFLESWVLQKY